MPKAQRKKAAVTAKKSAARKPVARAKSARPAHPKKRVTKAAKPAARRAAKPVAAAKKAVAKIAKVAKVAEKLRPKAAAPAPVAARTKPVPVPPPAGRRPEVDKKRTRRPRPRVQSNGAPVAAWLNLGEKPRPSSFIPAPPRAEAPSLIAAPPASSDRLFREGDLSELAVRTVPVRVDVEMNSGRVYLGIIPEEVSLRVGEGIEWDFRYLGGSDVTVDELVIEFEKPSPFPTQQFRSRKPGTARPHRQMSGAAQKAAAGKRVRYTVRAITAFKTDIGIATPWLTVTE